MNGGIANVWLVFRTRPGGGFFISASWVTVQVTGSAMKKVAIFGNTGGGKSTLAKELADITGLPLITIDMLTYKPGGESIPHSEYLIAHSDQLKQVEWIIDGFGCVPSAWERFAAADTLIYVDLPLFNHFVWVTKRFFKGIFVNPVGWPERSPIVRSTITSYRVLWLCHRKLTPRYRQLVSESRHTKNVLHLKSPEAIRVFLTTQRQICTSSRWFDPTMNDGRFHMRLFLLLLYEFIQSSLVESVQLMPGRNLEDRTPTI